MPHTVTVNPQEIADYLQVHGWCRSSWQDEQGRCCIGGAAAMVVLGTVNIPLGNDSNFTRNRTVLLDALESMLGTDVSLYTWNDSVVTGSAEIIERLRDLDEFTVEFRDDYVLNY